MTRDTVDRSRTADSDATTAADAATDTDAAPSDAAATTDSDAAATTDTDAAATTDSDAAATTDSDAAAATPTDADAATPTDADAADAFALVADETRVAVLTALLDSWETAGADADYALSFSTLHDRVGTETTAHLNYHLDRLRGRFVRTTDDGYVFTPAGWQVARTVADSDLTATPGVDPFAIPGRCYACGTPDLRARYVNEWVWVDCTACGEHVFDVRVPPGVVAERSPAGVAAAVDRRARRRRDVAADGVCPACLGPTERRVGEFSWGPDSWTRVFFRCADCGHRTSPTVGAHVLEDPAVAAFYRERGVDVTASPLYEFAPAVSSEPTTVVGGDPPRFRVAFPAPDATLSVTVDASLAVVGTEVRDDGSETGYPAVGDG